MDKTDQLLAQAGLPRSFCAMPWTHMQINTRGRIRPCCIYDGSEDFSSSLQGDLDPDQAINSSDFRDLRQRLLAGQKPQGCRRCWQQEESGIDSYRQSHLKDYTADELRSMAVTDQQGAVHDFQMHFFDFRLRNICNLKCRMCGPNNSSRIAAEYDQLGWDYEPNLPDDRVRQWYDAMMAKIHQARKVYFAGGEPLLMDTHYAVLVALLAADRRDVRLAYATNLTQLRYKRHSVLDLWPEFSDVTVRVSIDHVDHKAAYLRHGAEWQDIEQNIAAVRAACPKINLCSKTVVTVMNLLDLPEICDRLLQLIPDARPGSIDLWPADWPAHLDVRSAPISLKQMADQRLLAWCDQHASDRHSDLVQRMRAVIDWMWSADLSAQHAHALIPYMQQLDQLRDEDMSSVLPEVAAAYAR